MNIKCARVCVCVRVRVRVRVRACECVYLSEYESDSVCRLPEAGVEQVG